MDILINNMEMPKSCLGCDFTHICKAIKILERKNASQKKIFTATVRRLDGCPLVALPPHGELIDRNALIERIGDNIPEINTPKEYLAVSRLLAEIGTAQTIVEATE